AQRQRQQRKKVANSFLTMHMHEPENSRCTIKNIRLLAFLITDFHSDGSCDCCNRGECCDCDKCSDFDKCCDFDDCFDCDDCCVITVTNDL
ncbi:unnamed protein product, partial [Porites lobata]